MTEKVVARTGEKALRMSQCTLSEWGGKAGDGRLRSL